MRLCPWHTDGVATKESLSSSRHTLTNKRPTSTSLLVVSETVRGVVRIPIPYGNPDTSQDDTSLELSLG